MIRLALGVGRAMTAGGDLGNFVRRVVLPKLHRLPGLSAKVLDSKTPRLRRSALVVKSLVSRRLTGTLCPNPVVAGDSRLDTEIGDGFAVITATEPGPVERALIARRGALLHIAAPGTELARWLRHGHAGAAIIRPDRTVMRAGRDVRALSASLPHSYRQLRTDQ
jgi:3-(3-hydroxy-phenyl)propionate hydroxylase